MMGSQHYFDAVATDWDRMRENFFPTTVRTDALRKAAVRSGAVAADIGAGTGFVTEALLAAGLRVIAVDQSEEMLRIVRRKHSAPELDCRRGVAEALPIDTAAIDHVFANMYLHHVEDPADAIREMTRILRPGGTLVLTDLDRHEFDFLLEEHHDRWPGFARDQILEWMRAAGLRETEVASLSSGCTCNATSDRDGTEAAIQIFVASGTK